MPRLAGRAAVFILLGGAVCALSAAAVQIPPSPSRWVTDTASFLSPPAVQELDRTLERYERDTGHQVLVYIGRTTEGEPIEDFAVKTFAAWKVGRKSLDDGLVLFIMAEDRRVRIEVGYGLEAVVPDIVAGRIINDVLVPKIRAGDPDGGARDAVAAITQAISGKAAEPAGGGGSPEPRSGRGGKDSGNAILLIIGGIVFLIIFITNPRLALWLLFNMLGGGGRGGGRGFGGGGFSGGGGRSGGGGASGGW